MAEDLTLADLLGTRKRPERPIHAAQVATLRETYLRHKRDSDPYGEPRFRAGDIVSVVPGCGASEALSGEPLIVMEMCAPGEYALCGDTGHVHRENVRVAYLDGDGDVVCTWLESWRLRPYGKERDA